MQRDTITQLIAALVCIACLAVSGVLAIELTASSGRHRLVYTQKAVEGDPPQVAMGVAMGAFRGLFVNMLWIRANALKEDGRFYESMDLARAITKLQPRFPQVWVFHAWNMAYNISVATQTPQERWQWVQAGINLLRQQGIPANPNDLLLHKELAWIFLHKIGGYMDDANLYYKRQLAAEWTEVLGPPPRPDPKDRDKAHAVEKYLAWLRPIVEAPEASADVVKAEPSTADLVDELREKAHLQPDFVLVRYYARMRAIADSGVRLIYEQRMSPQEKAFLALVVDPKWEKAWGALMPFLRRRMLTDVYNMEPERMYRYTEMFGPLDWRHYGAHAAYWAQRGVEKASERVSEENRKDFDFVNSGRVVVQAMQELWRSGDVSFDFLGYIRALSQGQADPQVFYRGSPNIHFMDTYGENLYRYVDLSWADQKSRVYSLYAAGYENFRKDAIRYLYRRGEKERARKMKDELAEWEFHNINNNQRKELFALDLDDFVKKELEDALTRPSVAREEVVGAIQGALLNGLLIGDDELFRSQMEYAKLVHTFFFNKQGVKNALDPNQLRMAQMDPDFGMVVGSEFVAAVEMLDIDDAERLYEGAPETMRVFGYDLLIERFKEVLDQNHKLDARKKTFDQTFPEPPGIQEHRRMMAERAKQRGNLPTVEYK
jgi:hypothetical protein